MDKAQYPYEKTVFVCTNQRDDPARKCCAAGGGAEIRARLKELVKARGLQSRIRVSQSGCLNQCARGPNIVVFPERVWYSGVTEADLEGILDNLIASLSG
jgi:(2Fe-2S) ferredoxin